jgi:AraC-like DNA-binding protein
MTAPPEKLAEHPSMTTDLTGPPREFADPPAVQGAALGLDADGQLDLLSELLRSVRLRGERIVAYAPRATFSIGFAGTGALHIIEHGELDLAIDGEGRVDRLHSGDVILLPRGDAHHIANSSRRPGGGEPPRWLCGTFTIGDSQASHLLASLPPAIILRGARDQALEWLEVSRRMLLFEMQSPSQGSAVMVARILDLLFIQILRAWAARVDAEPNWLAGALDPEIGPAFRAIHGDSAHDWTVEELARACNLSRSAFAERFVARVGTPPATYLAHVRLDAAATLLQDTSLSVALVAAKVGYTSEAAFSRAFKRVYGTPPARWRRDARP